MFIKIDYELGFSSICNTENEVIEGCRYEVNEITFEEFIVLFHSLIIHMLV